MVLLIRDLAKKVKVKGPDLLTRPIGRSVFAEAAKRLVNVGDGETVVCDFDQIQVIDPSFVDEFVVKMLRTATTEGKKFFVRLKNISRGAELNIRSVFDSYEQFSKLRLSVVSEDLTSTNSHVIGSLKKLELEIIETLRINGRMRKAKIAAAVHTEESQLDEVLGEMLDLRIIKQEENVFLIV